MSHHHANYRNRHTLSVFNTPHSYVQPKYVYNTINEPRTLELLQTPHIHLDGNYDYHANEDVTIRIPPFIETGENKRKKASASSSLKIILLALLSIIVTLVVCYAGKLLWHVHVMRKSAKKSRQTFGYHSVERPYGTSAQEASTINRATKNQTSARATHLQTNGDEALFNGTIMNTKHSTGTTFDWFAPGDLIFTRQKPLQSQFERFVTSPKAVLLGLLAALPMQDDHPTHVAMVTSVFGTAGQLDKVEILDINSSRGVCFERLDNFLSHHKKEHFDVSVARMSKPIKATTMRNIINVIQNINPQYGTAMIVTSILPREENQFVDMNDDFNASTLSTRYASLNGIITSKEIFQLPHYSNWNGIGSKKQTCSSLIYAILEYIGYVARFVEYDYGNGVKTDSQIRTVEYGSGKSSPLKNATRRCRILEPESILPADFLRKDFQWTCGVHITQHLDLFHILS